MAASITEVLEALVETLAVAIATGAATSILVASGCSVEASESLVSGIRIVGVSAGILAVLVVTSSVTVAAIVATLMESKARLATVVLVTTIGFFATMVLVSSEIHDFVMKVTEVDEASVVTEATVSSALELSGLAGHSKDRYYESLVHLFVVFFIIMKKYSECLCHAFNF